MSARRTRNINPNARVHSSVTMLRSLRKAQTITIQANQKIFRVNVISQLSARGSPLVGQGGPEKSSTDRVIILLQGNLLSEAGYMTV